MRALVVALAALTFAGAAQAAPRVLAITFGPDLEINPVTQGYLTHELSRAASDHYDAAVIVLDTPGGLSTSMKTIFTAELNAKVPVIVYVSPDGARAASAGVWVAQAADVLAMAPTTNIGSSTPIDSSGQNLGSDLRRKVINDSVASLTALAQVHHRNTTWPAKAVRVASNLTASQALHMNVIDMIAPTLPALLNRLADYKTKDTSRPFTLHLAGAHVDTVKPGFVTRFLNTIIDPNLISIFFLAGIAGLIFEVLHPGIVLPGALGAVCLVVALYGFSILNPSWGGVALVLLGMALLVIDLHAMTHGALTIGGLVALGFGLALLFQNEPAPYRVNTWLIVGIGSALGAFWAFALGKGFAARRLPVSVGTQMLVGKTGEVRAPGLVFVNGELWQAHADDDSELVPGEQVEVESIRGLELTVRKE
ncbi:MAG TPA: nodulation protein NfeD [Gaiellaceae bacterium]|jgi:membrane-bound serine protease (ClpP class)|nr:nodulation protein NfeD [Gaiellaceae bacterium]HZQ89829.1 nodulation protein NfeD [Gaiellaceae bacterium]